MSTGPKPSLPPTASGPARAVLPALAAVLVLALGHTVVDLYVSAITPLLPHFKELWALSTTSLGLLAASTALTGALFQPLIGLYLDRRGTSLLAAVSVAWTAATVVLLGWLPSYAALFALATITVLGSAVYHPLGAALTRRVSPPDRRGAYMGLFMNIGNLGWASAPILVTWYATTFGLKPLGWLALPGIVVTFALAGLGLTLARRPNETVFPVAGASRMAGVSSSSVSSADGDRRLPALASRAVRSRGVFFLVAATILRSWAATGIQTYLPVYLVQRGRSLTSAGASLTLFILAGTVAGFCIGWLSDRFGRRSLYVASLIIAPLSFAWFLVASGAWAAVAVAVTGAALLGSIPLTVVLVQEMLPNRAGTGSGLVIGFAGGLGGLLVLASGVLADRLGLATALWWLIPILPLAALCAFAIPEEACRQPRRLAAVDAAGVVGP